MLARIAFTLWLATMFYLFIAFPLSFFFIPNMSGQ